MTIDGAQVRWRTPSRIGGNPSSVFTYPLRAGFPEGLFLTLTTG